MLHADPRYQGYDTQAYETDQAFVNKLSLCQNFHELIEQQQQYSPLEILSASALSLLNVQMHS